MQPDKTIEWMLDCRLGMFIHWGLYSGPGRGEWHMENQGISPEKYRELAYPQSGDLYFTAKDFNAEKWVNLAQKAGMKYMNMVTHYSIFIFSAILFYWLFQYISYLRIFSFD